MPPRVRGKVIQLPLVTRFVQPGAGAPAAGRTQSRSWEELLKEASRGPMQFLLQEAFRERPLPFPGSDPQTERTISGSSQDRDSALQVGVLSAVLQSGGLATRLPPVAIEARRGGLSRVVRAGSSVAAEGLLCRAGCPGAERLCSKWAFGGHLPAGLSCCPVGAAA